MGKTANIATPTTCPHDGWTTTSLTSYTSKCRFSCFVVIVMIVFIFPIFIYLLAGCTMFPNLPASI